jgi:tRNA C32,U32 (ribose-2'-O)-methylase TrmJ
MYIEELQNDVPSMIQDIRNLLADLECAESCDNKADFCENVRSAISKATIAKQELSKLLKSAEKCKGYASV